MLFLTIISVFFCSVQALLYDDCFEKSVLWHVFSCFVDKCCCMMQMWGKKKGCWFLSTVSQSIPCFFCTWLLFSITTRDDDDDYWQHRRLFPWSFNFCHFLLKLLPPTEKKRNKLVLLRFLQRDIMPSNFFTSVETPAVAV